MFIRFLFSALTTRVSLTLICICICVAGASAQKTDPGSKGPAKEDPFKTLVAKLKGGDTGVDFKALRIASADSDAEDSGQVDREEYKKIVAAVDAKKNADAISVAEKALKSGYMDINTHMLLAVAYRETGNKEKFAFHKAVYLGLVNSILAGADGKSPSTAYVVINVAEEYALLGALGLKRDTQ